MEAFIVDPADIGRAALAESGDGTGRLLVYAEVEDGTISCDIFYEPVSGQLRFRFASSSLQSLVYRFWDQGRLTGDGEWRVMSYFVNGSKFSMDLTYPEQLVDGEDTQDRRPLAVGRHFGDLPIDYSGASNG